MHDGTLQDGTSALPNTHPQKGSALATPVLAAGRVLDLGLVSVRPRYLTIHSCTIVCFADTYEALLTHASTGGAW